MEEEREETSKSLHLRKEEDFQTFIPTHTPTVPSNEQSET